MLSGSCVDYKDEIGQDSSKFTVYKVVINLDETEYIIWRRYSDFLKLYDYIKEANYVGSTISSYSFPAKAIIALSLNLVSVNEGTNLPLIAGNSGIN